MEEDKPRFAGKVLPKTDELVFIEAPNRIVMLSIREAILTQQCQSLALHGPKAKILS